MISTYQLLVQSVDFLGKTRDWEFTVVAKDEAELNEELTSVMGLHGEVKNWSSNEIRNQSELDADSPFLADYRSKGAHSYLS